MPEKNMKRNAKLAMIRQMIANAGLADAVGVMYDRDHFTVRAMPAERLPSPDEEQTIIDIFDSCSATYVWLDGTLRIRRAQSSARARRARRLYRAKDP